MITNNTGAITSKHDYTPYGEELWAGLGTRTTAQGYRATNLVRQRYGLTERDEATGLEHTWFRKYENGAGRWTSPDPYNGSFHQANPQSLNRYLYVGNDPLNSIDPVGLMGVPAAAINTVKDALSNPICRSLFGKTDPLKLFDSILKGNRLIVSSSYPSGAQRRGGKLLRVIRTKFGGENAVTGIDSSTGLVSIFINQNSTQFFQRFIPIDGTSYDLRTTQ